MEIVLLVAVVAFAGWFFFLRTKKVETKVESAPYKVEAPVVVPEPVPTPAPEPVGKPADDRVEETAPVAEVKPKKKASKPKAPKAPKAEVTEKKVVKSKADAKAAGIKRAK